MPNRFVLCRLAIFERSSSARVSFTRVADPRAQLTLDPTLWSLIPQLRAHLAIQ
jgi:hypothetical protein